MVRFAIKAEQKGNPPPVSLVSNIPKPTDGKAMEKRSLSSPGAMRQVSLLGVPLEGYRQMQQYHDEILREFTVLDLADSESFEGLPGKLQKALELLQINLAQHHKLSQEIIEAAFNIGSLTFDITYPIPVYYATLVEEVLALLQEADKLCSQGLLLTLCAPKEIILLRNWYYGQILDQLNGSQASPWITPQDFDLSVQLESSSAPIRLLSGNLSERKVFKPAVTTPKEARKFVLETLTKWGFEEAAETAELLTSELVTNSVLHAKSETTVFVGKEEEEVTVAVSDQSSQLPAVKNYDFAAGTGRGLQFIEMLSSSWGVESNAVGKIVWFKLPINQKATEQD